MCFAPKAPEPPAPLPRQPTFNAADLLGLRSRQALNTGYRATQLNPITFRQTRNAYQQRTLLGG